MKKMGKLLSFVTIFAVTNLFAATYTVPPANKSLIGNIQYIKTGLNDNSASISLRYNIGHNAMINANPHVDISRSFAYGTDLQIPTQHLLPNKERKGIVVNLPEMRMYYYLPNNKVLTYPVGIGKIGKTIPLANAMITRKTENPTWTPPQDIREFNLEQGVILPKVMPPGPDNPLGNYAVYMTIPTYLIHSTIFPDSVGKRASFGCLRMFESDIKEFFPIIESGVPVVIIDKPVKVGMQENHLYMEAYQPLEENSDAVDANLPGMVHEISQTANQDMLVDWQLVSYIAKERDGIPHEVGIKLVN